MKFANSKTQFLFSDFEAFELQLEKLSRQLSKTKLSTSPHTQNTQTHNTNTHLHTHIQKPALKNF